MAVNVSTTASVCLYCKISSVSDTEKEFHEIYDEVGIELQLPTLVEKFFQIKLQNKGKQECLCEDCVNRLVELFDLEEHAKEEAAVEKEATTVLSSKIETEVSNKDVFENESVKLKVNKEIRKSFENSLDTHLTQVGEDEIVADSDNDLNLKDLKGVHSKDQPNNDLDDNEISVTKNIFLQNNLQEDITSDNDIDLILNEHQVDHCRDQYNSDLDDIESSESKNFNTQNNFLEETTSHCDVDLNSNDLQGDHSKDQYNSDLDDIEISVAKNNENEINLHNNFTIQDISIKLNQHFIEQDKDVNYSDLEDIENYEDNKNKPDITLEDNKSYENRNQSQNTNTNLNNSESLLQNKQQEKREESDPVAASESENNEDYDDDITYVEEKDELNFDIQNLINTNTNDDEFVIVNEADAISNDDNDDEDIQSSNDNENFTEENIYENVEIYEALLDTSTIDTDNPNTQDIIIEEIQLEDKNLKTENADHKVYTTNDQNVVENLNISKEENEILIDSDGKSFNSNDIELDEIIVKEVNDIEDDTYSIEEEYLIEGKIF